MRPGATILIAGSSRGLGRALAEHYCGCGHIVFGLSRGANDVAHENYRHLRADVTDEDALKQAFAELTKVGLPADVLIYAAGLKRNSYALLTTAAQASAMLDANLLGAFLATRQALRPMMQRGFGRVIYLSSIAVPLGSAGTVV